MVKRKIEVVPYDPQWPKLFEEEVEQLKAIFGTEIVAAHHVGSTAVPGVWAKPIIDVLLEVRDINRIDGYNDEMIAWGYLPKGTFGIAGRRFFIKGNEVHRTHHIHVFERGHPRSGPSPTVQRYLDFRSYLTAHPAEANAYAQLKRKLARQFPHDIDGYMAGKDDFIKEIERKATVWKNRREEKNSI